MVFSADNFNRHADPFLNENISFFYPGTARYSVPAGHYWAIGDFLNFTRTSGSKRLVVLPQFSVTGQHTRVRLDGAGGQFGSFQA
jgi:hypothetical protein